VSLIARVPHASDALSGKVTHESLQEMLDSGDHRAYRNADNMRDNLDKADAMKFLWAKETGRTIGQAAIAAILAQPGFVNVLPTCLTVDEVREYASANENPLSEDEHEELAKLYSENFGVTDRYEMELRKS
jgi:aryl-alcohol dehydrogenase-like predicted oxidoreductase